MGGLHGKLITAWSAAGVLGPLAITKLRDASTHAAITDLAAAADPAVFECTFGAPVGQLEALIEANTVTIARLMEILPAGTVDPTPGLYDTTMVAMAGVLGVGLISNAFIRPVHPKHHMRGDED